jgi:hypothetical protein
MNTSQETLFILSAQTGLPVILKGMPGEAKSSYMSALATATNRHLEVVIASTRDPSDFGGFPCLENGALHYVAPAWVNRLIKASADGRGGILFFDEISCAAPMCQNALLRVILEKVVGETPLPKDTWIVAAMNPTNVTASGWDLAPPMSNRFVHMNWEVNTETWIEGMITGFQTPKIERLPENWEDKIAVARCTIAAFIKAHPTALRNFPKEEGERSGPWASPRTWDMAARISAAFEAAGYDDLPALSAVVGDAAARTYHQYRKALDLPNPETLLANPEKVKFPASADKTFAIIMAVTSAVLNKNTSARYNAAWKILQVAVNDNRADLAASAARVLAMNKPKNHSGLPPEMRSFLPILQAARIV